MAAIKQTYRRDSCASVADCSADLLTRLNRSDRASPAAETQRLKVIDGENSNGDLHCGFTAAFFKLPCSYRKLIGGIDIFHKRGLLAVTIRTDMLSPIFAVSE
jgi:hypothetical protein